jgi:hypothetical protein
MSDLGVAVVNLMQEMVDLESVGLVHTEEAVVWVEVVMEEEEISDLEAAVVALMPAAADWDTVAVELTGEGVVA